MTGGWRCGRCGGLVQGRTGLCHGQVYGTHCNTPGPCVTPARKCNARAGGAPTRAGGGTGGQPTPTPARPHIGRLPGADIRPHRRRSRRITQSTHATPGAATPTPAQSKVQFLKLFVIPFGAVCYPFCIVIHTVLHVPATCRVRVHAVSWTRPDKSRCQTTMCNRCTKR